MSERKPDPFGPRLPSIETVSFEQMRLWEGQYYEVPTAKEKIYCVNEMIDQLTILKNCILREGVNDGSNKTEKHNTEDDEQRGIGSR